MVAQRADDGIVGVGHAGRRRRCPEGDRVCMRRRAVACAQLRRPLRDSLSSIAHAPSFIDVFPPCILSAKRRERPIVSGSDDLFSRSSTYAAAWDEASISVAIRALSHRSARVFSRVGICRLWRHRLHRHRDSFSLRRPRAVDGRGGVRRFAGIATRSKRARNALRYNGCVRESVRAAPAEHVRRIER